MQRRLDTIEAPLKIFSLYLKFFGCSMHYGGVVWPDSHTFKHTTSQYVLTGGVRDLKFSA